MGANLKAAASAADPSSSLARNMLSPRLQNWLAGWLAGWGLVNLMTYVDIFIDFNEFTLISIEIIWFYIYMDDGKHARSFSFAG